MLYLKYQLFQGRQNQIYYLQYDIPIMLMQIDQVVHEIGLTQAKGAIG
jgi:DNA/RNA-binding domain of Phe-tRNA-synthetase-like protein